MDYKEKVIALLNSKDLSKEQKEKLESIFPELAEFEDKRIKKCISDAIKEHDWSHIFGVTKDDCLAWLEKQYADPIKEYWRGYREGMEEILDKYAELEKQGEQKQMKIPEESLGIDSETYNKIVDECIYGEKKSAAWSEKDEKEYKYVLKFVDNILNNCGNKKDYEHCKRCYDWLKSLKERIGG